MAEYVKVSRVISYIKGYAQQCIELDSFDLVDDILTICEAIEKMDTADMAVVKHGHWEPMGMCIKCSECGLTLYMGSYDKRTLIHHGNARKYCERCGTKMDSK